MKWIVLVTDFFKPSLRKKAWDFLTNILNSNEKEIRYAFRDKKLAHVEILNFCHEKGMTVRQASLYSVCMVNTQVYEKCFSDIDSPNTNIPLFIILFL
jgi:hypothetical protein